jgi:hypothetical protein
MAAETFLHPVLRASSLAGQGVLFTAGAGRPGNPWSGQGAFVATRRHLLSWSGLVLPEPRRGMPPATTVSARLA